MSNEKEHTEKLPIKSLNDQAISLSESVAVTVPTPNQLQLVHTLEDTYRARYKSDYFPQKGSVRRPRYVADNAGNHYVTLQMPREYNRDFKNEYIRVALITTSINDRGHYYSPYKFQTNHNDVKVLDQNPIYVPVQVRRGNDSTMKLLLVFLEELLVLFLFLLLIFDRCSELFLRQSRELRDPFLLSFPLFLRG